MFDLRFAMVVEFMARHLEAHSRHELRLHVLHELRAVLHRGDSKARRQQHFGGRVSLQLVQNRNDID
jgi:hypothetical protein